MKYIKADCVFPNELLNEIQKYVQGELVYIPKPKTSYKKWGESTDSRQIIIDRNNEIRHQFLSGVAIDQLADDFYLSVESIKKIVYTK